MGMSRCSPIGLIALLATGACYGLFAVFVRELAEVLSGHQQVFLRQSFAVVFVLAALGVGGGARAVQARPLRGAPVAGFAVAYVVTITCFTFAVLHTSLATAALGLYGGSMLGSMTLGRLFFREVVTGLKAVAIGCCLLGVVVTGVHGHGEEGALLGLGLGNLAGLGQAAANACRRALAERWSRMALAGLQGLAGMVLGGVLVVAANEALLPALTPWQWALVACSGAISVVVALLLVIGFHHFDLSLGVVVLASEILFAALFGQLLYGERPTWTEALGAGLILGAIGLVALHQHGRGMEKIGACAPRAVRRRSGRCRS